VAILAVDEVWLREPRLLVPGCKPVERVRVDFSHPLGALVEDFWLFGYQTSGILINLGRDAKANLNLSADTSTKTLSIIPPLSATYSYANNLRCCGMGLQHPGVGDSPSIPMVGYSSGSAKNYGNRYCCIHLMSAGVDNYSVPSATNYSDGYVFRRDGYHAAGGAYVNLAHTQKAYGDITMYAINRNGDSVQCWQDGLKTDTKTGMGTSNLSLYRFGFSDGNIQTARSGYYFTMILRAALPDTAVASLMSDPYQFLTVA
jgi:hypothetical protein